MKLRREPGDFVVREVLADDVAAWLRPKPDARACHAVYRLEKRSLSTPDACRRLAIALGVRPGAVTAAGLKDTHAVTTQHVSVRDAGPTPAPEIREERWAAHLLGWRTAPLAAECIERNEFELILRGLGPEASDAIARRARELADPEDPTRLMVLNFFGAQRFVSARHGQGFAAVHLVRGEFEAALRLLIATPARKDSGSRRGFVRACAAHWRDWPAVLAAAPRVPERKAVELLASGADFCAAFAALPHLDQRMAVEAFASHVWNGALHRLAAAHADGRFPRTWTERREPLPAPGARGSAEWEAAIDAELAVFGLTRDRLVIPGLRRPHFGEADRPLAIAALGFELGPEATDELASRGSPNRLKRPVRFSLPRGAYATVVVAALGEPSDEGVAGEAD